MSRAPLSVRASFLLIANGCFALGALLWSFESTADVLIWSPRVQVSHTVVSGITEVHPGALEFQRDGAQGLHVQLSVNKAVRSVGTPIFIRKTMHGNLLSIDTPENPSSWSDAWDERFVYTYDPYPSIADSVVSTDHHFIVDADNEFHVCYEDWARSDYSGGGAAGNGLGGYKSSRAPSPRWNDDIYSYDLTPCIEKSPNFFLWEGPVAGSSDDTLHVTASEGAKIGAGSCVWKSHQKKAVVDPDSSWSFPGRISMPGGGWTVGEGAPIVVDQDGILHCIQLLKYGDPETHRVIQHLWGEQPDPDETMSAQIDTLDLMEFSEEIEEDEGVAADMTASSFRSSDEFIDVAWNHVEGDSVCVLFSRIEVDDPSVHSTPIQVSPDDYDRYGRARVSHDDEGRVILTYMKGNWLITGARLYMSIADGDPTNIDNWTIGIPVTQDVETWAADGFVAARADTLHLLYASNDDGDAGDNDMEAWYQLGVRAPGEVLANQRVEWSGQVSLDADFVIAAAGTLDVAEGTIVTMVSNTDRDDVGRYADKTEIINRGVLLVDGSVGDRVTFQSSKGGEGEWGGIWFDVAASPAGYGFHASRMRMPTSRTRPRGLGSRTLGLQHLLG